MIIVGSLPDLDFDGGFEAGDFPFHDFFLLCLTERRIKITLT